MALDFYTYEYNDRIILFTWEKVLVDAPIDDTQSYDTMIDTASAVMQAFSPESRLKEITIPNPYNVVGEELRSLIDDYEQSGVDDTDWQVASKRLIDFILKWGVVVFD